MAVIAKLRVYDEIPDEFVSYNSSRQIQKVFEIGKNVEVDDWKELMVRF